MQIIACPLEPNRMCFGFVWSGALGVPRRNSCAQSRSQQSCSPLCRYALMECRPRRGAPNTAVAKGAEATAVFIRSSNAWLRSGGTVDFARAIHSKIHIWAPGTREGALGVTIRNLDVFSESSRRNRSPCPYVPDFRPETR